MPLKNDHESEIIGQRRTSFLFYAQLTLVSLVVVFLCAMFIMNVLFGAFDLLVLSYVSASMLTLLIFLDFLILLPPKRASTQIVGTAFTIISFMPVLIGFFYPTLFQNELTPIAYVYFYSLFYGAWNLSMYKEQKETVEREHPQVMILLLRRGFFFMLYGYLSVIPFTTLKILFVETMLLKVNFILISIVFLIFALYPVSSLVKLEFYLRRTKKGRKIVARSFRDEWKKSVDENMLVKVLWYFALPLGALSVYGGAVCLYSFVFIALKPEYFLAGLLALGGGISILMYHWTRTGSLSKIRKILLAPSTGKMTIGDLKESLRDLQKWCFGLFGAVFALIGLLRYKGIRVLAVFGGVEINDMTLVYVDIFWLLTLLLSAEWLLQLVKRKRITDLAKLSKNVDYLHSALWYFLAGLTGSYSYALGVPIIVDAMVVVAFLLITTIYRVYLRSRF